MLRLALHDVRTPRAVHPLSAPRRSDSPLSEVPIDPLRPTSAVDALFAYARDALVVGDVGSGRIVRWNAAAERLFGYSATEAVGRAVEILLPPPVACLYREQVAQYVRSGDADILTGCRPLSITAITRSGEEVRVELSVAPFDVPPLSNGRVLLTFRDASCERRAELNALEATRATVARAEVETRLQRCQQLLRDTTRDLRKPVSRARRAAARLARQATSEEKDAHRRLALLAHVVELRTLDLQRILAQLDDEAAIEAGAFELQSERVNLVPLVSRLVSMLRSRSAMHRLNLAAPQGLTAHCDPGRIEAVLRDVLERAIRRNPRGCWIYVDIARPLAGTARIEVLDYGRPLTSRERERLAISLAADRAWLLDRYIVEQHGGSLDVEFPREGGLKVIISLPTHRSRHP